jgi:hypothetical protein
MQGASVTRRGRAQGRSGGQWQVLLGLVGLQLAGTGLGAVLLPGLGPNASVGALSLSDGGRQLVGVDLRSGNVSWWRSESGDPSAGLQASTGSWCALPRSVHAAAVVCSAGASCTLGAHGSGATLLVTFGKEPELGSAAVAEYAVDLSAAAESRCVLKNLTSAVPPRTLSAVGFDGGGGDEAQLSLLALDGGGEGAWSGKNGSGSAVIWLGARGCTSSDAAWEPAARRIVRWDREARVAALFRVSASSATARIEAIVPLPGGAPLRVAALERSGDGSSARLLVLELRPEAAVNATVGADPVDVAVAFRARAPVQPERVLALPLAATAAALARDGQTLLLANASAPGLVPFNLTAALLLPPHNETASNGTTASPSTVAPTVSGGGAAASATPTGQPSVTGSPTAKPSAKPTQAPSAAPTAKPTQAPSSHSSGASASASAPLVLVAVGAALAAAGALAYCYRGGWLRRGRYKPYLSSSSSGGIDQSGVQLDVDADWGDFEMIDAGGSQQASFLEAPGGRGGQRSPIGGRFTDTDVAVI